MEKRIVIAVFRGHHGPGRGGSSFMVPLPGLRVKVPSAHLRRGEKRQIPISISTGKRIYTGEEVYSCPPPELFSNAHATTAITTSLRSPTPTLSISSNEGSMHNGGKNDGCPVGDAGHDLVIPLVYLYLVISDWTRNNICCARRTSRVAAAGGFFVAHARSGAIQEADRLFLPSEVHAYRPGSQPASTFHELPGAG